MRDELMSQSESLQNDISNLSIGFKQNKESINSINKKVSGLGEKFADLKNLYSVNESKLKNESQFFKKNIESLNISQREINTSTVTLGDKILNLQQKMDDNSKNYAIEKGKILEEIEGLRTKGESFSPAINDLNAKLDNLTKTHDLVKNTLLGKMKTLEEFNKTKFIEIENKNEDFKKRYDKDTGQLQRELGVVRAGIDERGRETNNLAGEVAQTREAFGNFEKQSNVKFKTLFDYNTYTNRQIKKQNTNKLTTLGNIRKAAQPDLLKKAFAGLIRGRFFDAQPILY
jgi:predicted  nucleic acid-binding Zn-ribbon protein